MRVLAVRRVRRYARPRYRGTIRRGRAGRRAGGRGLAAGAAGAAAALFLGAAGQGCFYRGCPLPPEGDGGAGSDSAVVVPTDSGSPSTDSGWPMDGMMAPPVFLADAEAAAIFRDTMNPALAEAGHGGCLATAVPVVGEGYAFEADEYCAGLGVGFEYEAWEEMADPSGDELTALQDDPAAHFLVENCWSYSWDEYWPEGEQVARDALRDRVLEFIELLKSQGVL